ncbi:MULTISPECIES: protein-L-isoaspartate O-methyltransferase [Methylobacterium]|uniref:Protein-L-isoaspartate O-methyltransferase n=2 Tax=Pseudomonadota TaxID=1224 RepID=A0ABQ4SXE6_9HYPH|nr:MULTISPECIES: protein-L-isoaspartate O-methyltransferase [Methylobacterium]PIU05754.1 MAG: protein-L-isoaspartate O-methyltransferase [Methylobacterium sp. CG09_land_8_20_14_0_10_71_15]PIU15295.1 MAG: protein-L-isoaspartate O-methyltransferase [Methylobacterium sp. CG08_land_8_20_14_0_20_71_15]GBU18897.1 L-isoaspartate protein carboxylmethyltransferase type II [Methylobacterium sp.]GJE06504.1 Protein-L-isoaspartate O-methyltransferase [Methylobacterium jeotgali]
MSDDASIDGPASYDEAEEDAAFVLALRERGVRDTGVLRAMERVPRARFAPPDHRDLARRDMALPLPCGATMTAPTLVATMLVMLGPVAGARILEIGTGSGYVAALLAGLGAAQVVSLERYAGLAAQAARALAEEPSVRVMQGDGLAPLGARHGTDGFERILANGAVERVPQTWLDALAPGGRLVAPLATRSSSRLILIERGEGGSFRETLGPPLRLPPLLPGLARVL